MEVEDTIPIFSRIRQILDARAPRIRARPYTLIAAPSNLYVGSVKNHGMDELFAYDDVGGAVLALRVDLDAEFDLQTVAPSMRTRLHILQLARTDETGRPAHPDPSDPGRRPA
jgi:hypothetical protein